MLDPIGSASTLSLLLNTLWSAYTCTFMLSHLCSADTLASG